MMGRYSLWLVPSGGTQRRLRETIERLGRERGGPLFEPHLTLLGGLDGEEAPFIAAARRLSASLRPVDMHLCGPEFGDTFYRCLYLRVEKDVSLTAAHGEARRLFSMAEDPPFMPHLSLFYGALPRGERSAIASTLDEWRDVACRAGRLRLVATGGGPLSWRSVREISLNSPRRPH